MRAVAVRRRRERAQERWAGKRFASRRHLSVLGAHRRPSSAIAAGAGLSRSERSGKVNVGSTSRARVGPKVRREMAAPMSAEGSTQHGLRTPHQPVRLPPSPYSMIDHAVHFERCCECTTCATASVGCCATSLLERRRV
ncbi:hypothetical protein AAT19DRAFT_13836 [Rhodotorula toruloides]|uniref:Uncharacterized protein n=1 Tax=Rhodotorula toruloides TaxID=5286 RepID=A0A2T0A9X4_RHOTO|nr:hypothetical protein AAT19DRAFT_13836 [Rhodotorula toruloides]